jgi:hypothetical protein
LLVSQNLGRSTSNLQLNGNIAETAVRFGGSAFGRIGGGGGIIGDDQIAMLPSDDRFYFIIYQSSSFFY